MNDWFYKDEYRVRFLRGIQREFGKNSELSFLEFQKRSMFITSALSDQRKVFGHQVFNVSDAHILYMVYQFERFGDKIFEISKNLSDKFMLTHIKDIQTDLLRLPFGCIQIALPSNSNIRLFDDRYVNSVVLVDSIYVYECFEDDFKSRMLRIHALSKPNDQNGVFNVFYRINLSEPNVYDSVNKSIQYMTDYYHGLPKDSDEYQQVRPPTPENLVYIRETFEYILKCILYITSSNADIYYDNGAEQLFQQLKRAKSGGKQAKLMRRIQNYGRPRYKVGNRIVVQHHERQIYDEIHASGGKLTYRFQVRGHWRNQAYGEHHSQRKLIFIDPFMKGPEFADVVNKDYVVK